MDLMTVLCYYCQRFLTVFTQFNLLFVLLFVVHARHLPKQRKLMLLNLL